MGGCLSRTTAGAFDADGAILLDFAVESKIAFVYVGFLRKLRRKGKLLPRRQKLPRDAYVIGEDLPRVYLPEKFGTSKGGGDMYRQLKGIFVISHGWLSAEHPDPTGARLEEILQHLDALDADDEDVVFMDFVSLPQLDKLHPEYQHGQRLPERHPALRTREEDAAFKKAMERMELLYASGASRVVVLPKIHSLDAIDSSAYTKNTRPYDQRGWCCVELLIASFFGRVANPQDMPPLPCRGLDPEGVQAAMDAGRLHFTSSADRGPVLGMFKRYYHASHHELLVERLRQGGAAEVCDGVRSALRSMRPEVRRSIALAISGAGEARAFFADLHARLLKETNPDVLAALVQAFLQVAGAEEVAEVAAAVADILRRGSGRLRERLAAVRVLELLPSRACGAVVSALAVAVRLSEQKPDDPTDAVPSRAINLLGRVGTDPELLPEERAGAVAALRALLKERLHRDNSSSVQDLLAAAFLQVASAEEVAEVAAAAADVLRRGSGRLRDHLAAAHVLALLPSRACSTVVSVLAVAARRGSVTSVYVLCRVSADPELLAEERAGAAAAVRALAKERLHREEVVDVQDVLAEAFLQVASAEEVAEVAAAAAKVLQGSIDPFERDTAVRVLGRLHLRACSAVVSALAVAARRVLRRDSGRLDERLAAVRALTLLPRRVCSTMVSALAAAASSWGQREDDLRNKVPRLAIDLLRRVGTDPEMRPEECAGAVVALRALAKASNDELRDRAAQALEDVEAFPEENGRWTWCIQSDRGRRCR